GQHNEEAAKSAALELCQKRTDALAQRNARFTPSATPWSIRMGVARKLADASSGWNAVAVGFSGRPGLALKAATETGAVNEALGNCARRDSDCHVIAI